MTSEMTPEALVDLLQLFESSGIEVWLDRGWGVDALLGTQTRPHKDVDIILRIADLLRFESETSSRQSRLHQTRRATEQAEMARRENSGDVGQILERMNKAEGAALKAVWKYAQYMEMDYEG
jgi:hypothetical protein